MLWLVRNTALCWHISEAGTAGALAGSCARCMLRSCCSEYIDPSQRWMLPVSRNACHVRRAAATVIISNHCRDSNHKSALSGSRLSGNGCGAHGLAVSRELPVMCRPMCGSTLLSAVPCCCLSLEDWCAQGSAVIREMEKRTSIKSCNTDEGGCGRRGPMQQFLEGQQPRAFALQLVWESLQEAGQDIRDTLELIQEVCVQAPFTSDLLLSPWTVKSAHAAISQEEQPVSSCIFNARPESSAGGAAARHASAQQMLTMVSL